jgi:hypothetical protein
VQTLPAAPTDQTIDALEVAIVTNLPAVDCPITHRFTPGLYIREMFAPAGSLITSKIHRTQHPFVLSAGRISVWTEEGGWVELCAPYTGITEPGTRRVAYVHEDAVWTTFHPTDKTDPAEIEAEIIEPRADHLIGLKQPPALPPGATPCHS